MDGNHDTLSGMRRARTAVLFLIYSLLVAGVAAGDTSVAETSLDQQTDIAVTAYNNGLALVRDTRKLALPTGEIQLKFMDVAEKIRPETVGLRSLSQAASIQILEQNYEYDLISPSKLLEKYVGKPVKLVNHSTEVDFDTVEAELLSTNGGAIYRVNNEIYLGFPGTVVLPEIPANLIAKPSLIWLLDNAAADQTLEVTYLTQGISWTADYVVTLARDDPSLHLAGWVTMNNQSGATFSNAQLKLVAGEVNIVQEAEDKFFAGAEVVRRKREVLPREEAFAEYHLYTMPRRTTIKQNESKQLALLEAADVTCAKKYEYRGQVQFYSRRMPPRRDEHVSVFLEFRNDEKNRLGMPLPAGTMRIYQEDQDGALQFAGEDRIQHTPKDEKVRLRMGNAFDVVGERIQTDFKRISQNVFQAAFEITVRNHKENEIQVDVVEPMPSDWEILEKSQDYVKKDAQTAIFSMTIPPDGEGKVVYRVQVRT
ncbi:MAG: DUF4139 domain-containing protein [Candidatus Hydrogenedentes bacterium]|nr:DUF4139 domain-containing protein [Candidatus Hydrogenedentota bacterium]